MPKSHHRAGSSNDRYKELREFGNTQQPNLILSSLVDGRMPRQKAERLLESTNAYGLFRCGELYIQDAYDSTNSLYAFDKLMAASKLFRKAIDGRLFQNNGQVDSVSSRANLQLNYIPIHDLIIQKKLPSQSLAQKVHEQTLSTAYDLLNQSGNRKKEPSYRVGALGEFAVLGLLERLAINKIGSEIYFPAPSTFDQDYGNSHGSVLNRAWDINIYGDVGDGVQLESRIQVKSNENALTDRDVSSMDQGISILCVDPDLKLENDYKFVIGGIINDLIIEFDFPEDSQEHIDAISRLDERTEMLLVMLGHE